LQNSGKRNGFGLAFVLAVVMVSLGKIECQTRLSYKEVYVARRDSTRAAATFRVGAAGDVLRPGRSHDVLAYGQMPRSRVTSATRLMAST
jgi:hypothetical protein